ncbi:TIGR03086 family metal-binding protein [Rhodococcus sp. R1101]|uniref:TIGR03086 family metal-binding protein n=1 Tax=Rhodococcus sp. R1101 TaxID=1170698 RepID=UPI000311CE34|nr:TIGR03086 family metal-binding protein [Rhodococcus sp. R1101]
MNTTALRHAEAYKPLTDVISSLRDAEWDAPSPCEGWTARDVLAHIIDTQREFFDGRGVETGERPDTGRPAEAWQVHTARIAEILADDALVSTTYEGYFGPTTVGATFEQFYIWDMLVHRWDIARSAGAHVAFSDAELDRMEAGADSFGDALYMDGVCAPAVDAADDADRTTRILAKMGRRTAAALR